MENFERFGPEKSVAVTGEVIYESVHHYLNKKAIKSLVQKSIEVRLREVPARLIWASYLVIFSPGQEHGEVRCQVDVETDADYAGFAIGFGQRPNHAFNDAIERLQWHEKRVPFRVGS
jgi:hypothetical protein